MYGLIYKITNLLNSKVYIGQTTQKLERRLNQHSRTNFNGKLYKAMKSYGKDKFSIESIAIASSQEELDRLEIFFIDEYRAVETGYNLTYGGRHYKVTQEHREKLSKAHNPKPVYQFDLDGNFIKRFDTVKDATLALGDKTCSIRQCLAHKTKQALGFQWSYNQDSLDTVTTWCTKVRLVCQQDPTGKIVAYFKNASVASKETGIARANISTCCLGKTKLAGGFRWCYVAKE